MKYLIVGDYNWEDEERITESWKKYLDRRERDPENHVKNIFATHRMLAKLSEKTKDIRVFAIIEADSEEQIINQIFHFGPYADFQYIPLADSRKVVQMWMGWEK